MASEAPHVGNQRLDLDDPCEDLFEVTPNDNEDLPYATRAIYVGSAGDVKVTTVRGNDVVIPDAENGWHPVRAKRIHATGTTATGILGGT